MNFEIDPSAPRPIVRRDFLKKLGGASTAAWMSGAPQMVRGKDIEHPAAKADACVLLWLAGGMAAPETFDPKRYAPFEKGMAVDSVLSTFPKILSLIHI